MQASAQSIPYDRVLSNRELVEYLKPDIKKSIANETMLAQYFRNQFAKRYFYDWHENHERFVIYNFTYKNRNNHQENADAHMNLFADSTSWVLPFKGQNGSDINAYALRHLARQHKMVDVAMMYYFEEKDPKYIHYFTSQMRSLNAALAAGKYEKMEDGNGTYEAFRSGFRVHNWLQIHAMFLGEEAYTSEDQLTTVATLLQHGQDLYEHNAKFSAGNHQTKGMSSLAMLAIMFQDVQGTEMWYERAMERLGEHLKAEINGDGLQSERTVHYHMSDIDNYFYVYQLAKKNNMPIGGEWEDKLKSLFTSLVKIAYPDKSAPVFSDDTNEPWAERNDISGTMTLGYLLFNDAQFGYFSDTKIEAGMYWFTSYQQMNKLENIDTKKPSYPSLHFPDTKYYVLREGYDKGDKVMVVSAGVDSEKPDHQHGDILGIQASALGKIILPNYQVRYSLPDYELFKNSIVKNVALVDDELQGKLYAGNKGGSGFGKFGLLPSPTTIAWETNEHFDLYVGSHDGFEKVGVNYSRQVIYVKDAFWIVKDNFKSDKSHTYKQVWQGHYTPEGTPNLLRSSFEDAVGCDIYQLNAVDTSTCNGTHGKQWNVVSKEGEKNFEFITIIYPYKGFDNGIDPPKNKVGGWKKDELQFEAKPQSLSSLSKGNETYLFGVNTIEIKNIQLQFDFPMDCHITFLEKSILLYSLGPEKNTVSLKNKRTDLQPGEYLSIDIK
jgi:hypothetical protein